MPAATPAKQINPNQFDIDESGHQLTNGANPELKSDRTSNLEHTIRTVTIASK